jgi:hypothetical protein
MWTRPGYNPPDRQSPPQEQGERLATFPRGPDAELRCTLAEYQGNPYIALRVWERDTRGAWFPVRGKGCSVRIAEASELAEVLARVGRHMDPPTDGSKRVARQRDRQRGSAPLFDRKVSPAENRGEFNEFE